MTDTVKMPEPGYFTTKNGRLWTFPDEVDQTGLELRIYTEAQLKQYGDDRGREALEMAAKVCFEAEDPDDEYISTRHT